MPNHETRPQAPSPTHLTWLQWFALGTRLSLLMPINTAPVLAPSSVMRAWQFVGFLAVCVATDVALARWLVLGEANFYPAALPLQWITFAISALAVWLAVEHGSDAGALRNAERSNASKVGTILGLLLASSFAYILFSYGVGIAAAHIKHPAWALGLAWLGWGSYWLVQLWAFIVAMRIYHVMGLRVRAAMAVAFGSAALGIAAHAVFPGQLWYPSGNDSTAQPPQIRLSQALFESQAQLLTTQLAQIKARQPDQSNVYALVYAPYAPEDVFLKESRMVAQVLNERFKSEGRIVSLVNNIQTTQTHAWASPENLQRALKAIAAKMSEEDVLVLYLTSHGAKNFKLASAHWPLATDDLSPQELASMLSHAGIKHRIIAVSACYSGGWIEPLKTDHSLIMTAADATHTSYGCGTRSELTFFGRAVFSEGLRETASFEEAFARAIPVIKKREEEAGKDDGFSNPQIFVGEGIKPLLRQIERQIAQAALEPVQKP